MGREKVFLRPGVPWPKLSSGMELHLEPGRYVEPLVIDQPGVYVEGSFDEEREVEIWRTTIHVRASGVGLAGLTFRQSPATAVVVDRDVSDVVLTDCGFLA